jgi:hypothetical protein
LRKVLRKSLWFFLLDQMMVSSVILVDSAPPQKRGEKAQFQNTPSKTLPKSPPIVRPVSPAKQIGTDILKPLLNNFKQLNGRITSLKAELQKLLEVYDANNRQNEAETSQSKISSDIQLDDDFDPARPVSPEKQIEIDRDAPTPTAEDAEVFLSEDKIDLIQQARRRKKQKSKKRPLEKLSKGRPPRKTYRGRWNLGA